MQIKDPIIFAVGAALGAGVTWFFTKRYYEKLSEQEIESVKKSFKKLQEDAQKRADAAKNKPDISVYAEALNKARENELEERNVNTHAVNYTGFTEEQESEDGEEEDGYSYKSNAVAQPLEKNVDKTKPYLLNRMPYQNEEPYYNMVTIMYYADGTYAEPHGKEIEVIDYIGENLMGYVEETDKDEIFIRNEELELDIDIVKDARTYDEIMFG